MNLIKDRIQFNSDLCLKIRDKIKMKIRKKVKF